MDSSDNPFADLIAVNNKFQQWKKQNNELSTRSDLINQRKQKIFNQITALEDRKFPFPSKMEALTNNLMRVSDLRKNLYQKSLNLFREFEALNSSAVELEKETFKDGKYNFTNDQRIRIELMIVQWEQITEKQEKNIKERLEAYTSEETIILEIENELISYLQWNQ